MPQKDTTKKTNVSKLPKDKRVHIVKHFQPVQNQDNDNCELPEVNNDTDVEECLEKVINYKRFSFHERKSKNSKDLHSQNDRIIKSPIKTQRKSQIACENKTESSLLSKSCVGYTENLDNGTRRSCLRKKLRSSAPGSRENTRTNKNKKKNILLSSSSPDFNETYVKNLKKEISANRCKTADSWVDTKLYLMHKNEVHNEKVKHLREEIKKLVNIDLNEKKNHVVELKTEIAEFRRNDCVTVYNVKTKTAPSSSDSEKEQKSEETSKTSINDTEEAAKTIESDISSVEQNRPEHVTEPEDETAEKEITSTDLTEQDEIVEETETSASEKCRKICLLSERNEGNPGARLWVMECKREELLDKLEKLHKSYRMCGAHFEDQMFLNFTRNRLHTYAVPRLFPKVEDDEQILGSSARCVEVVGEHSRTYSKQRPRLDPELVSVNLFNPTKKRCYQEITDTQEEETVENIIKAEEGPSEIKQETSEETDEDVDTDSFFRGVADIVKKLPPERQAKVKKEIMNIVLDSQLWVTEDVKENMDNT